MLSSQSVRVSAFITVTIKKEYLWNFIYWKKLFKDKLVIKNGIVQIVKTKIF